MIWARAVVARQEPAAAAPAFSPEDLLASMAQSGADEATLALLRQSMLSLSSASKT